MKEERSSLIMKEFKEIVDLVRMNKHASFDPDILDRVEGLISLMSESEEGDSYYFQSLMEEVKKVNYDEVLVETMSLVSQLKAKQEFYNSLNL